MAQTEHHKCGINYFDNYLIKVSDDLIILYATDT